MLMSSPKFGGAEDEDVEVWAESVKRLMQGCGFEEHEKVVMLKSCTVGAPLSTLKTSNPHTLKEALKVLKDAYKPPLPGVYYANLFERSKREVKETVAAFASRVRSIATLANANDAHNMIGERAIMQQMMKSFTGTQVYQATLAHVRTVDDLVRVIQAEEHGSTLLLDKRSEGAKQSMEKQREERVNNIEQLETTAEVRPEWVTELINHIAESKKRPRDDMACYNCQKTGHRANECTGQCSKCTHKHAGRECKKRKVMGGGYKSSEANSRPQSICRDWKKGSCTRQACKFSHKYMGVCKSFEKDGTCTYAEKCRFEHKKSGGSNNDVKNETRA